MISENMMATIASMIVNIMMIVKSSMTIYGYHCHDDCGGDGNNSGDHEHYHHDHHLNQNYCGHNVIDINVVTMITTLIMIIVFIQNIIIIIVVSIK